MKKIIGLQRKKVVLLPYNPAWKKFYKKEEKLLHTAIGKYVMDIRHVGSTSIPGAKSKPIIDIAIGVRNLKLGEKCIKPLKKIGYEYRHSAGVKGRHFFAKGTEKNRTHYLHLEKINGKNWQDQILFRDYLRCHKQAVRGYNILKVRLAKKYKDDRDTYTSKKDKFIRNIIDKAKKAEPVS